jgi:hypothetical protein
MLRTHYGRLFETTGEFREPEKGEFYAGGSGYRCVFPSRFVKTGSMFGRERIIMRMVKSGEPMEHCDLCDKAGYGVGMYA